jgi:WD40 repeat protein
MYRKFSCLAALGLVLIFVPSQDHVTAACSANTSVSAMAFSSDSHYFGAVWTLNVIRIWDVQTSKTVQTIKMPPGAILPDSFAFSPDGQYVAYADRNIVHLLEFGSGREIRTFKHNTESAYAARALFVAKGSRMVTWNPKSIVLWDIQTGQVISTLNTNADYTNVSPDGRYLLTKGDPFSTGVDYILTLWDLLTHKMLYNFHRAFLFDPIFSPDGKKALLGGAASTFVMLDTIT